MPSDEGPVEPEAGDRSPFAGLPRYGGGADIVHLYVCRRCEVPSRNTHLYSLPTIVCLVVFLYRRIATMMMCPRCMRLHILTRLPLAILLANLASPLVILWWLVVFVKTFFSRPE